ncbi:DNA helicase IV [Enterobacillus tribolii]|uniref:DNA 3'-5' helicase n=1 Tax=Enterobacillus tribolii TaxID=1487935 RepID=A0A370QMQ4_9GAMM|nr:DNA helicase IV [Enterobacillus tribolii]MBW7982446.1 DNA helicase IV [Enterobacillus tribolii]RDK89612.1 DNA helicase-4 [Enterobacillus tribolii]
MELKATTLGKHLAQHPYNRVRLLSAGIKVSGERHEYLIPFNQLLAIHCKRGIVWGELEFELPEQKVVRLHGTDWQETQHFYHHLQQRWQAWSEEMAQVSAGVLAAQAEELQQRGERDGWLKRADLKDVRTMIEGCFKAVPLPQQRLEEFPACRDNYRYCLKWLTRGQQMADEHNHLWCQKMLAEHADFFARVETQPLNPAQAEAVVNGEDGVLVLAGAGSGKTSVLVARTGWLLLRKEALPQQILLLAFGRKAAEEMDQRIAERLQVEGVQAKTFHALALHIIQQASKKQPVISRLESDARARQTLLTEAWQQQCQEKKAQAKGWRQWLEDELEWTLEEDNFWQDERLAARLAPRLERWIGLMRSHGGSQVEMIEQAPEEIRDLFQKRIRLMAPLLKAWKGALKDEGAVDFAGLIQQAIALLEKGRFISPWKHILVDEFQDISPQRARLLEALRKQNAHTCLFAVGDDWQAIYRFSGAELSLTTSFSRYFGDSDRRELDTTYRFNRRIGEIANAFIQQNPAQLKKPLNSLRDGDKKSVVLLPQERLEALLDKMSGYVKPDERVLILARYHYLKPEILGRAETRWPRLNIDFMTIHASKGKQADYVIVLGLQEGRDGFPAPARESVLEQVLLPQPEDFPDAEERRLLYVALTRARHQVWVLYDGERPSVFVDQLRRLGVPQQRKP